MRRLVASLSQKGPGVLLALGLATCAWLLGERLPLVGGAVLALVLGLVVGSFWRDKGAFAPGLQFSAKKLIQYAVVCLGFGLDLGLVFSTGRQVFPLLMVTILGTLLLAGLLGRLFGLAPRLACLIGVGTAICGGSAIAATAPVIEAEEEEVAQAMTLIFLFNLLAALLFPTLGSWLGLSAGFGEAFGVFAGTAVNDTSSVTAVATAWDSLYDLGSQTLDKAVTVKLTRTLAILPITAFLAYWRGRREPVKTKRAAFPAFILWFLLASLLTSLAPLLGISLAYASPIKYLARLLITVAMAAIGLNANLAKLLANGRRAFFVACLSWAFLTCLTLLLQAWLGIW